MLDLMKSVLSEKKWTTKDMILSDLKVMGVDIDERKWRLKVAKFNDLYQQHETKGYMVIHSEKGYKLTKDYEEMRKSDEDLYKRAMNMLKRVSRNKKTRGEDLHLYSLQLFMDAKSTVEE